MLQAIRVAKGLGIVGIAATVLVLPAEWAIGGLLVGSKSVVISGKGNSAQSTSNSSNGFSGSCARLRLVVVSAAITDGTAGNDITVTAKCVENGTTTIVGTVIADVVNPAEIAFATETNVRDDGGTLDDDEFPATAAGTPRCERVYTGSSPHSNWTVSCYFLFF